jgi:UDP-N-acetylglucosamine enolpyruvyl transferase
LVGVVARPSFSTVFVNAFASAPAGSGVYHIDRGYEHIEEKLKAVGAQIKRIGEMFPKKTAAAK